MTIVFISVFVDKFFCRPGWFAQTASVLLWFFLLTHPLSAANIGLGRRFPNEVRSAVPDNAWTTRFFSSSGWTGGDADYSMPLTATRSLWVFGDSFVGTISNGRRNAPVMVHNSAAWLDTGAVPHFFWNRKQPPTALVQPPVPEKGYYWPGAIVASAGKIALFCKRVEDTTGVQNGFGFEWVGQDLVLVDNPPAQPARWRTRSLPLDLHDGTIFPGAAAVALGDFVYVFSTLHGKGESAHPAVLQRISPADLAAGNISQFQYWCADPAVPQGGNWLSKPHRPIVLFADAAPEMSVSPIKGLSGLWAVYSPHGLSADIFARHADRPEGPWSEPKLLYHCPEPDSDGQVFCYGAKAHPELSENDGELIISYCANLKDFAQHATKPLVYFPHFIRVQLAPRAEKQH